VDPFLRRVLGRDRGYGCYHGELHTAGRLSIQNMYTIRETYLLEVLEAVVPAPRAAAIFLPFVICAFASSQPGIVVQAAASSQNLTPCVVCFEPLPIFLTLVQCRRVLPVVLALDELKRKGWDGDLLFTQRIIRTGFDDEDGEIGVLSQTACDGVPCCSSYEAVSVVAIAALLCVLPPTTIKSNVFFSSKYPSTISTIRISKNVEFQKYKTAWQAEKPLKYVNIDREFA
jgi:hypothetical protein